MRKPKPRIPSDFVPRPLKDGEPAKDRATCGTCGLSWDDAVSTARTPTPAGRCPFEHFHFSVGRRLNKWHDEVGPLHILKRNGAPACGVRYYTTGGSTGETEPTCGLCKRLKEVDP